MLKIIKYANLALFAVMIVMNYLANALPLNNATTGELSDSYCAFSIVILQRH